MNDDPSNSDRYEDYFGVVVLNRHSDYPNIKRAFTRLNILTQCIAKQTARKINLSVASNIMKQINSKCGGESLRMKWPTFMKTEKVMVIGIDVCHAGKNSVVGFCATTNEHQTKYYSDIVIQKKGQEIVKENLNKCLSRAVDAFAKNCNG